MPDLATYLNQGITRVPRAVAMALLAIENQVTFNKVVAAWDAQPGLDERDKLVSKLPGERRAKYRIRAIDRLLNPPNRVKPAVSRPSDPPRRATRGEGNHL